MQKLPLTLLVVTLFLAMFVSCQKEMEPGTSPTIMGNSDLTIDEAKEFFNQNLGNVAYQSASTLDKNEEFEDILNNKKPRWEESFTTKLINGGIGVKVPLAMDSTLSWRYGDDTLETMNLSYLNYLLIFKDRLSKIHIEYPLCG